MSDQEREVSRQGSDGEKAASRKLTDLLRLGLTQIEYFELMDTLVPAGSSLTGKKIGIAFIFLMPFEAQPYTFEAFKTMLQYPETAEETGQVFSDQDITDFWKLAQEWRVIRLDTDDEVAQDHYLNDPEFVTLLTSLAANYEFGKDK